MMAMKKLIFTILAFASLFILSCQKEDGNTADENNRKDTFSAVVEDGLKTRGDYEISGSTAVFSWTNDDEFYRFVRADNGDGTYGNYNHYTYRYSSGSGSSVEFSGSSVDDGYADTGFALYPTFKYRTNTGATFGYKSGSDLYFQFNGTITFNSSNPLKNIVPMLGKLDGSTYTFKPLVGVVAVTLTNIPADANKVELSTTDKGMLNGNTARFCDKTDVLGDYYINDYLGPETHGLRKCWINGTTKTFTFVANSFTEATFYFPVATTYNSSDVSDPYTNFTVTVKQNDDTLVTISKTGISITVDRGEIVALPIINCNYAGTSFSASLTGDASNIKAYYSVEKGTIDCVRAVAITSKSKAALDSAIPDNSSGTDITAGTSSSSAISITSGFSNSGAYYIGVKAFNGDTEVGSKILAGPVYYLQSDDVTRFCKKHTDGRASTDRSNYDLSDRTITLAVSDDPLKGNIIMTEFDGMSYNAAPTSGARFYSVTSKVEDRSFVSGTPFYGKYTPTDNFNAINLVFASSNDTPFFTYDSVNYRLCANGKNTEYWNFCLNRNTGNYYIRNWNEPTYLRDISSSFSYAYSYWFEAYHYDSYGTY